jgi:hypothetical protein
MTAAMQANNALSRLMASKNNKHIKTESVVLILRIPIFITLSSGQTGRKIEFKHIVNNIYVFVQQYI